MMTHCRSLFIVVLFTAALLAAPPAHALAVGVNAGASEVITLPDGMHAGFYPSVGASLTVTFGRLSLIPGLSIQWAPESDFWGFVGTLIIDYNLLPFLSADLVAALLQDQLKADFANAALFGGLGPGLSFLIGPFSISPLAIFFRGLNVDAWAFVPTLLVGYTF